jgi:hypothetical protein
MDTMENIVNRLINMIEYHREHYIMGNPKVSADEYAHMVDVLERAAPEMNLVNYMDEIYWGLPLPGHEGEEDDNA